MNTDKHNTIIYLLLPAPTATNLLTKREQQLFRIRTLDDGVTLETTLSLPIIYQEIELISYVIIRYVR